MKLLKLALCSVFWAGICYAQTSIRPDQIAPGTPDITWGPGGPGYQIGSTVPWRTDGTANPLLCRGTADTVPCTGSDNAMIVELTFFGAISATLPAATGNFASGAGFSILVGPGRLTLTPVSGTLVNNKGSLTVGPYQIVSLYSRGTNWYAAMSVPQPAAQAGANVLCDNMTWAASCGATAATISGVTLSNGFNFTANSTNAGTTIDTLTANCSVGSCSGATFALATTGTCSSATSNGSFNIPSGTNNLNIGSTAISAAGNYPIGIAVTLAGATNSGACFLQPLVGMGTGVIALVNKAVNNAATPVTSLSTTLTGTSTAGNLMVVEVGWYQATDMVRPPGVTSSNGTCTQATGAYIIGVHQGAAIFWCTNTATAPVNVVFNTSWLSDVGFAFLWVQEYSGAATSGVDAGVGNSTSNGVTGSTQNLSLTPNQTNELVISILIENGGTGVTTGSPPQIAIDTNNLSSYQLTSTSGTPVTHTYNVATAWNSAVGAIAAFKHP